MLKNIRNKLFSDIAYPNFVERERLNGLCKDKGHLNKLICTASLLLLSTELKDNLGSRKGKFYSNTEFVPV